MGDVIPFPVKKQEAKPKRKPYPGPTYKIGDKWVKTPKDKMEYLQLVNECLPKEHFDDVLLAITDRTYYTTIDSRLQAIVDCYYGFDK